MMFLTDKIKASEILNRAEEAGISIRTIKRAKAQLGIKAVQEGREWYWIMPD
jgi:hypothetical protein